MATQPLHLLPPLEWRGRQYPVTSRNVSFAHESVQHKLQRRNRDLVEQMGAHNLVFTYTIPMREGIYKGPYRNLFIEGLSVLLADCRNKRADILLDPIYGEIRAVPSSWNDETDVQKIDGTDIRVEFMQSPEDDEIGEPIPPNLIGIVSDGREIDVEIQQLAALELTPEERATIGEFEQFEGEEGSTDVLSAIAGAGAQIQGNVDRVSAYLEDVAYRAEKIERVADRLENPDGWQLRRSSRRARDAAIRLQRRTEDPFERTRVVTLRYQRTLTSIAAENGVALAELLRLNRGLANSPLLPPGTQVLIPDARQR